jgi:lipopolysaccharide transport system ATP-binding protein
MGTISVSNLGKAYKQYPNRWGRLLEWLTPGNAKRHQLKWVLQDINFTVNAGEAVGIIGINGAGKSTLLKLITGTTQPTTGSVHMTGRVAAMLELGMGFHPDFTGRQNAFMAGQLLGISSEDIARLMPEIEAFAEIGDYIDQPVRVYSSGMQMRLAFSVATAQRPDLLIIDEALSVGDDYFQFKSFQRIRSFNEQGTTLLIVSHDKTVIQAICSRAILLNTGEIAFQGTPEAVMDYYNALVADKKGETVLQVQHADGIVKTSSGTGEARLVGVVLTDTNGEPLEVVRVGQQVNLHISVDAHAFIEDLTVGYQIKDRFGQVIFGVNSFLMNRPIADLKPGERIELTYTFDAKLGEGNFSIAIALHSGLIHIGSNYAWHDRALIFQVQNFEPVGFIGMNWLPPSLQILRS